MIRSGRLAGEVNRLDHKHEACVFPRLSEKLLLIRSPLLN